MGHVLGAEKGNFLIRGRGRPSVQGGHAGLILSIPAKEVSLGSPRVGTIHVKAATPHAPILGPSGSSGSHAKLFMVLWAALMRDLAEICWKRQRMRCRRLRTSTTDPR